MSTCTYATKGLCVLPHGDTSPCCVINGDNLKPFTSFQQFYNDPAFTEVRQFNKDNNILESVWCDVCKYSEKAKHISLRQRSFDNPIKDQTDEIKLRLLDISFGNTCNLDCVMCCAAYSSKWASTHGKIPEVATITGHDTSAKSNTLSYAHIDELLENSTDLERVIIKGGEPLYDKKALYFIERLHKYNPTAQLNMVTNLTMLNDKKLDMLKQYKDINIITSCDGIGKVYEWIRGWSWDKLETNIDRCLAEGLKISVQFTIQAYNIANLETMYQHYIAKGMKVNFIFANEPWLHYSNIGKTKLAQIIDNLTAPITLEMQDPTDAVAFKNYTDIMNKQRGFNWAESCL